MFFYYAGTIDIMQQVPKLLEQFLPTNYNLDLTLDQETKKFSAKLSIFGEVKNATKTVKLHSKDLDVTKATVNNLPAKVNTGKYDELTLSLDQDVSGEVELYLEYHAVVSESLHGLYPSYYTHKGEKKQMFLTQFESHHAREMLPCVDEPAAKATFEVKVTTQSGMQVLSNMPVFKIEENNNMSSYTFDKSPKMSTYLLALVIGELHKKTKKTKSGVEVNVWATPAQRPESLDFALNHAVKTLEFFDDYFGVAYPLPKSDNVAVPDFSSGAMENWGLVTYRETALLADPMTTTLSNKQYIATVVSHELSHQWFGNLVTMQWWNNLWLNESFATIMEYVAVDHIHPEWEIWNEFASFESVMALKRDAIDGVQSVQVDVKHPDEISTLFDGAIVYAKGARLLQMLLQYLGEDDFKKGLKAYFEKHQYANTKETDLWEELSKASGKNVEAFMTPWISQPGYPVVNCKNNNLTQKQLFHGEYQDSDRVWPIPLDSSNPDAPMLMTEKELDYTLNPKELLNQKSTGHYVVNYTSEHLKNLLQNSNSLSVVNKMALLNDKKILVDAGMSESVELLDMLDHYYDEKNEHVWSLMSLSLAHLKQFTIDDEEARDGLRRLAQRLAGSLYQDLGWKYSESDSENDTKLRSLIISWMIYAKDDDTLETIDEMYQSTKDEELHPELRSLVLSSVVERSQDDSVLKTLINKYKNSQSADLKLDLCGAITSVKEPKHVEMTLELLSDSETIRSQDLVGWFTRLLRNRYSRAQTWSWLRENWSYIEKLFAGDKSQDYFPKLCGNALRTEKELKEYLEFYDENKKAQPVLTRAINMGEIEIRARIDLLKRDTDAVVEKLKNL